MIIAICNIDQPKPSGNPNKPVSNIVRTEPSFTRNSNVRSSPSGFSLATIPKIDIIPNIPTVETAPQTGNLYDGGISSLISFLPLMYKESSAASNNEAWALNVKKTKAKVITPSTKPIIACNPNIEPKIIPGLPSCAIINSTLAKKAMNIVDKNPEIPAKVANMTFFSRHFFGIRTKNKKVTKAPIIAIFMILAPKAKILRHQRMIELLELPLELVYQPRDQQELLLKQSQSGAH